MRVPSLGGRRRAARAPGLVTRARWLAGRIKHLGSPWGMILLYHRVADLPADRWGLAVTPGHFAEQMEVLRRVAQPVSLARLVESLRQGRALRRAVAITFDDGYADNFHTARPLLERFDVPATFFVATAYLGAGREFWWDDLERLVLGTGNGGADLRARDAEFKRIYRLVRAWPEAARCEMLDTLRGSAGIPCEARQSHRPLSADEVYRLARSPLVEIGAHTATHPVLSALPSSSQREEIVRGRTDIERLLGRPVRSFAYPHGTRLDYTAETVALAREAGFDCACTALGGPIWRQSKPLELPRVAAQNWDGETFERFLRGAL